MKAGRTQYVILAVGVAAVSTAAVLIRAADAPALTIAAYRLTLASLPLLALSAVTRRRLLPSESSRLLAMLAAGAFLALHFGFWTASVQKTSIVTSVVLVTAQPLFVALASAPLLGERPGRNVWTGIALASAGAAVMVAGDIGGEAGALTGDLYAILGAAFAAAYILTGRSLRSTGMDWVPYITVVYGVAAVLLVLAAVVTGGAHFDVGLRTGAAVLGLALLPQLIGHTAINRSLGYLPAATVALAILGEPVGATLLGAIFYDELPSATQLAGSALVLAGVFAGLRRPQVEAHE